MSIEQDVFLRFTPAYNKLISYGFKNQNGKYFLEKHFMDNSFKAIIEISRNGILCGKVYDIENDDEFLPLRIENNEGSFVSDVKKAYIELLLDIREKCFIEKFFVSKQGNRISDLINNKYEDKPVFMWDDYPTFGVFKNKESGKWYGLIMYISRLKLKEPSDKNVEVINLKLDKEKIPELLNKKGFFPAYHMNKKYWITISLDETVSDKEIMKLVDESYSYTQKKKK